MGQYHKLANLDAREFVSPHAVGSGLKAQEIVGSFAIPAALAGLISVNPGNGPADMANNKDVGRWAGQRLLFAGDYAKDDDVPDLKPRCSLIYGLCQEDHEPPTLDRFLKYYEVKRARQALKEARAIHRKLARIGFFTARNPVGMIEQGASVRIVDNGGWATVVAVRSLASVTSTGEAVFELLPGGPELLAYYKRCGVTEKDWNRPPRDGSWHGLRDNEIDLGQARVLANLDRREFIDPVAFGEVPTTAGMMRGEWGSASALCCLLFEPKSRGSGDLSCEHELIGAWRNHRVIASAEREGEFPTTDEIKATFKDISAEAFRIISHEKDN